MVPRDRAIISLFCTKQLGGKRKGIKEEAALLGVEACQGDPVQSQRRKADIGTGQGG